MKVKPTEKLSTDTLKIDVQEVEALLQAPDMGLKHFEPAQVKLKDGSTMLIREARFEEAPLMLEYVGKVMKEDHDYYDIVGARVYAEILGWIRKRLKDPYTLVGLIDGQWVGFANGRVFNDDINISLHSMALKRGLRIGAIMYYAKAQYAFETLNQKEWWATYESPNGWMRWGLGMAQPSYPWPDYQHELGGARVYYIRRDYWFSVVKKYLRDLVKADLERPVSKALLKKNEKFTLPKEVMV